MMLDHSKKSGLADPAEQHDYRSEMMAKDSRRLTHLLVATRQGSITPLHLARLPLNAQRTLAVPGLSDG
jgi:hypothetical protein